MKLAKLFHQLVSNSFCWWSRRIDRMQNSFLCIYLWEWMNGCIMSDPNEVVPVKQVVSFMTSIFFLLLQQHNFWPICRIWYMLWWMVGKETRLQVGWEGAAAWGMRTVVSLGSGKGERRDAMGTLA
jgi:hypothetical protein